MKILEMQEFETIDKGGMNFICAEIYCNALYAIVVLYILLFEEAGQ